MSFTARAVLWCAGREPPAKIQKIDINEAEKVAHVIVPESQLSLAIGKEGQNARLAAKLTGWKIDIISEEGQKKAKELEELKVKEGAEVKEEKEIKEAEKVEEVKEKAEEEKPVLSEAPSETKGEDVGKEG
jgi:N utilization substance protein A